MMAQDHSESIKEPINYGRFIYLFLSGTIKSINTKMCKQRTSTLFNIYIYIYIYINIYICEKWNGAILFQFTQDEKYK